MHVLLNAGLTRQEIKRIAKRWGRSKATERMHNPLMPRDCGTCTCHGLTWSQNDLTFMDRSGGYARTITCPMNGA